MKILLPECYQCVEQGLRRNVLVFVPLCDDNIYQRTCENGHFESLNLQSWKFDLLFSSATKALIDGYHRDAVTTFATSLERFYEFFIRGICLARNIDSKAAWKFISYSERQFGAFVFTYLLEYLVPPDDIENIRISSGKNGSFKTFRNDVVHNGYIPQEKDAIKFGSEVWNFVIPTLKRLLGMQDGKLGNVLFQISVQETFEKMEERGITRPVGWGEVAISPLRFSSNDEPLWRSFAEYLEQMRAEGKQSGGATGPR